MQVLHFGLLSVAGMLAGGLLYQLPSWLFLRNATWLTETEFQAAFPEKRWVTRATYGLLPLGVALAVVLLASTDDVNKGANWFFFFAVFLSCMGAMPAVPELFARVSVLIPVGHGSRTPVLYTVSPNAARAAVARLTAAALVVAVFLWSR